MATLLNWPLAPDPVLFTPTFPDRAGLLASGKGEGQHLEGYFAHEDTHLAAT